MSTFATTEMTAGGIYCTTVPSHVNSNHKWRETRKLHLSKPGFRLARSASIGHCTAAAAAVHDTYLFCEKVQRQCDLVRTLGYGRHRVRWRYTLQELPYYPSLQPPPALTSPTPPPPPPPRLRPRFKYRCYVQRHFPVAVYFRNMHASLIACKTYFLSPCQLCWGVPHHENAQRTHTPPSTVSYHNTTSTRLRAYCSTRGRGRLGGWGGGSPFTHVQPAHKTPFWYAAAYYLPVTNGASHVSAAPAVKLITLFFDGPTPLTKKM